jgi:hypothetical protein
MLQATMDRATVLNAYMTCFTEWNAGMRQAASISKHLGALEMQPALHQIT